MEPVRGILAGADVTDNEMHVADRIRPERLSFCLGSGFKWQPADTVTLIEAMQAGARQVRYKALQRKQAVIQWQVTAVASSIGVREDERRVFDPILSFSTDVRCRHLRTVLGLRL